MYESSIISPRRKNVAEVNTFDGIFSTFEKPSRDQVLDSSSIKACGNTGSEPMSPKHDPHFCQASPVVHPHRIQMTPNPSIDNIQEKQVEEDIDDEDIQLMESTSDIIMMDGGDDEEDNNEGDKLLAFQTKLSIGQPRDKYEQEADAVADRVMTLNQNETIQMQSVKEEEEVMQPELRMQPIDEEEPIQMKCAKCEKEEELLQPKSDKENMGWLQMEKQIIQTKASATN